jgi:hypothetical protein
LFRQPVRVGVIPREAEWIYTNDDLEEQMNRLQLGQQPQQQSEIMLKVYDQVHFSLNEPIEVVGVLEKNSDGDDGTPGLHVVHVIWHRLLLPVSLHPDFVAPVINFT